MQSHTARHGIDRSVRDAKMPPAPPKKTARYQVLLSVRADTGWYKPCRGHYSGKFSCVTKGSSDKNRYDVWGMTRRIQCLSRQLDRQADAFVADATLGFYSISAITPVL